MYRTRAAVGFVVSALLSGALVGQLKAAAAHTSVRFGSF